MLESIMKTTKCAECGTEIPQNYIVCPHCKARCRSTKKRKTAMIFAFCLGFVGVHNFYMGYFAKGILQASVFALGLIFLILGITTGALFLTTAGIVIMICDFLSGIVQGVFLHQKKWSRDKFGKKLLEPEIRSAQEKRV